MVLYSGEAYLRVCYLTHQFVDLVREELDSANARQNDDYCYCESHHGCLACFVATLHDSRTATKQAP